MLVQKNQELMEESEASERDLLNQVLLLENTVLYLTPSQLEIQRDANNEMLRTLAELEVATTRLTEENEQAQSTIAELSVVMLIFQIDESGLINFEKKCELLQAQNNSTTDIQAQLKDDENSLLHQIR